MSDEFAIEPNSECGGWDVLNPKFSDDPLAWFAFREEAEGWVNHLLGLEADDDLEWLN